MPNELLSSVHGRITKLALVYTGDTNQKAYFEYFATKLDETRTDSPSGHVLIFMGDENLKRDLLSNEYFGDESKKHSFKLVQDKALQSPPRWVRDPFIQLQRKRDKKNIIIETDSCEQDPSSRPVAEKVADEIGATIHKKRFEVFPFDGGNILAVDGMVFVGANQFNDWAMRLGKIDKIAETELFDNAIRGFIRLLDLPKKTKVLVVGTTINEGKVKLKNKVRFNMGLYSPKLWFNKGKSKKSKKSKIGYRSSKDEVLPHIDLFLTPTGVNNTVFLGKVQIISIGTPNMATANRVKELSTYIESVELQLINEGNLCVIPMPLPLIFDENNPDDWFFCFYNNCLVENTASFKRVWLPHISSSAGLTKFKESIECVEKKVQRLWKGLGFDNIMWVPNDLYKEDLKAGGAVHCFTKEIERF